MDAEALQRFLELEQQEIQASVEYCQETISEFSLGDDKVRPTGHRAPSRACCAFAGLTHVPAPLALPQTKFGLDGFTNFMLSMTDLVSDEKQEGSTLDQPLNRYFVATSHNTWLEAGQTVGPVSADQYATVLREGARCVESEWIRCLSWSHGGGRGVSCLGSGTQDLAIHSIAFLLTHYPVLDANRPFRVLWNPQCTCGTARMESPLCSTCIQRRSPSHLWTVWKPSTKPLSP